MEATNREIWKSIDEYANYEVSSFGRVRNATTEKILKQCQNNKGYSYVSLCKKGKAKKHTTHRLVANEFIDNPLNKSCVDHIDGNPLNNNIVNLRWVSRSENNMNRSFQSNTWSKFKGVCFNKRLNKWQTYISISGCRKHLGYFTDENEAALKYNESAIILFGEYAKLNVID